MTAEYGAERALHAVVVAAMLGCIAVSLVALVELGAPSWDGSYLVVFCVLTSLEGFFSYHLYRRLSLFIYGGAKFRLFELAALLVLLQLALDLNRGYAPFQQGLPRADAITLLLFLPVLLCHEVATAAAKDLDHVGEHSVRIMNYEPPGDRLTRQFFIGGVVLFILTGVTQIQNARLLQIGHPSASGPVVNVLVYFALGMTMLGQIRYGSLRARWREQGATLPSSLTWRWVRYTLLFLGLLAILAFLLPSGYAVGLLNASRTEIGNFLADIIRRIADLLSPLGITPPANQPPPRHLLPPPHFRPPPARATPPSAHAGRDWLALARVILFWLAALSILGYFAKGYLKSTGKGRLARGARTISKFVEHLWALTRRLLRQYAASARRLVPAVRRQPRARAAAPAEPLGRPWRFGARTPRERVLQYFLNVVERAERQGMARTPAQTPLEFEAQLEPTLTEAGDDMHRLTAAYLEARYSDHAIGAEEAGAVRRHWGRVQAALRRLRQRQ